jgi:cell fate regulator YaaT (PSP1 superfamily)
MSCNGCHGSTRGPEDGWQAGGNSCSGCPTGREALQVFDWLSESGTPDATNAYDVHEVMFKGGRKGYYRSLDGAQVERGRRVVVEADRGLDLGTVHTSGELARLRFQHADLHREELPAIVRTADASDLERWEANRREEEGAFLIARRAIKGSAVPMKLVHVEWQLDRKKITLYFTAEKRVDFRLLVRQLAKRFRARVELRQIGARDEAARIGGIGACGRELCCSTWLQDFSPVGTQSAKAQGLPMNPARLSGQCGRLKCCLNYELELYMASLQRFPRVDSRVSTKHGEARVRKVDIFRDVVWVQHRDGTWEELSPAECRDGSAPSRAPGRDSDGHS